MQLGCLGFVQPEEGEFEHLHRGRIVGCHSDKLQFFLSDHCGVRRSVIKLRDRLLYCRDAVICAGQPFLILLNLILGSSDLVGQHLRSILSLREPLGAIRLLVIVVTLLRLEQAHLRIASVGCQLEPCVLFLSDPSRLGHDVLKLRDGLFVRSRPCRRC